MVVSKVKGRVEELECRSSDDTSRRIMTMRALLIIPHGKSRPEKPRTRASSTYEVEFDDLLRLLGWKKLSSRRIELITKTAPRRVKAYVIREESLCGLRDMASIRICASCLVMWRSRINEVTDDYITEDISELALEQEDLDWLREDTSEILFKEWWRWRIFG